jgi:ribosomal protein S18 acetylase RimI-like enzyme
VGEAVQVRLAREGDGAALADLMARSPDAGAVGFTYRFSADLLAVMRALATRLEGAVATRGETPAGMVLGDFVAVQWSGAGRPGVYVSNLRVRPDQRRAGVARELARFGLDHVAGRLGSDAVVYAAVLEGNVSAVLARRLGFQATAPVRGALVPVRRTAPRPSRELRVRQAAAPDWPGVAAAMNAFYAEHDLWSPASAASLADFTAREVGGMRPNRLYLVERGGEPVAGLSVADRTPLVQMVVSRAPPLLRATGRALRLLAPDGALRALTVRHVWFRPGELAAARFLWQTLRFSLRERGGCLGVAYDPRDRLADVFRVPRWLPTFPARYLVRAAAPAQPGRPIYCVAGA